ncbi:hypothetical protein BKI52_01150 [marine bacterium AO1-C]|nr:hypothetical protein BKI52_01150 [marine bacterium AO1-C]
MKKLKSLSLNKEVISKLDASFIVGGGPTKPVTKISDVCTTIDFVTENCNTQNGGCPGGGTGISKGCTTGPAPTAEAGCTRETVELSFCNGLGLPAGCQSVGVCA